MDRLASEGMQFWSFYAQPSCTPGRAAMQTGRIPNRSGMTTVAFQGQGGGLPIEEWTIASLLKTVNYNTYFCGKWHLGEDEYAMPISHGYDLMDNVILYHLNAYTYGWESWNPDMGPDALEFFEKTTTGIKRGESGKPSYEFARVTEYNISELDMVMTESAIKQMKEYVNNDKVYGSNPFFMSINFGKNHQPNLPAQGTISEDKTNFTYSSLGKSKYSDSVVEMDYNVGRIMDTIRELNIEENTFVIYTVDNGAWQDVHPDAGYTPFRGTKGSDREGGSRVPAIAWWPGKIRAGSHNHDIVGGLDLLATFTKWGGITNLPITDRGDPSNNKQPEPIIFDSIDMSNVLFECGKPIRDRWFYFTEAELSPGAVRIGKFKAVYNLRGDNGALAGSDQPGQELGWRGQLKYVATAPHIYDLWQDPQERYDLFMNSFTEKTWTMIFFNSAISELMETFKQYPPRPLQSETYPGPVTITQFRILQQLNSTFHSIKDKIPIEYIPKNYNQ